MKILGVIILISIILLGGGIFFFSKQQEPSVPEGEVISRNGLHWHPELTIYIKGQKQEIPKDIGIGAIHQPIHTHDATGIIHMEMSGIVTRDETKLSNFFRIWGKQFSANCIFDKCNGPEGKVKILVNGEGNKEFENYRMRDGDKIEIRY